MNLSPAIHFLCNWHHLGSIFHNTLSNSN